MKKRLFIIGVALVLVLAAAVPALASNGWVQKSLEYRNIKITLNGKTLTPTDVNGNVIEPFIIDGTTYLPVRGISNALGLEVDWDDATSTVILKDPAHGDAEKETLRIGTNLDWYPFEFWAENGVIGHYDGIDMAIAKRFCDDNCYEPELVECDFDALNIYLADGEFDMVIAGTVVTESRTEQVDFSVPYFEETPVMLAKKGCALESSADLADYRVVCVNGPDNFGSMFFDDVGYAYTLYDDYKTALEALMSGKFDVAVMDASIANVYAKQHSELKVVRDDARFGITEYAASVKKGNTALLNEINGTIRAMQSDGTLDALIIKYFGLN